MIFWKILLALVITFLSFVLAVTLEKHKGQSLETKEELTLISPLVETLEKSQVFDLLKRDTLTPVAEQALSGSKGTYAVAIKNLKTGESYMQNPRKKFGAASLYKLWVMAEAFDQIKKGKLKEDEILKNEISVLNEKFKIATESAELTEGEIEMTVAQALERMIIISHNYSALLLSDRVGLSQVSFFLKENKFQESNIGNPPQTTAYDIALFFEKLYKGKLVDKQYSDRMIEILDKQQLNDRIPKYLPKDSKIAHKTGELGYFKHDAGIVFSQEGDYIIVVLSESDFPPGAAERIAQISKAVYNYFERK